MNRSALKLSEDRLRTIAYTSLLNLVSDEGINASGRHEIYGCIFGRDSSITILTILNAIQVEQIRNAVDIERLLQVSRLTLLTLVGLQGQTYNIESGEEPGKFIHEYRKEKFDHLLKLTPAWHLYPDGKLRNYDSIDATALGLLAIYRYYDLTKDAEFLLRVLPAVEKGLKWILTDADKDGDFLVEYEFHKERKSGGLKVQSWTDSHESLMRKDGTMPLYPIAPVEVQGYTWLCLRTWADFYRQQYLTRSKKKKEFGELLFQHAKKMKKRFNELFIYKDMDTLYFPAQALDGNKEKIKTVTGNSLLLLWATYRHNGKREAIIDKKYIRDLVSRSFMPDMFDETAGIRTMSVLSDTFNPREDSYHNGSFWPKLNSMCYEGLRTWEFHRKAKKLRRASVHALSFFQCPIELYIKDEKGQFIEFRGPTGQVSCREQAWSAAAMLSLSIA